MNMPGNTGTNTFSKLLILWFNYLFNPECFFRMNSATVHIFYTVKNQQVDNREGRQLSDHMDSILTRQEKRRYKNPRWNGR